MRKLSFITIAVALVAASLSSGCRKGLSESPLSIDAATPPRVPPEAELIRLSTATLLAFDEAARRRDFVAFHAQAAAPMREQFTPESLRQSFKSYLDKKVRIGEIAGTKPIFNLQPRILDDEVLILSGYYPTQPLRVLFRLRFLEEQGTWKVVGINVSKEEGVALSGSLPPLPDENETRNLIQQTLIEFDRAVVQRDFRQLWSNLSTIWRQQITSSELQTKFKSFIDRHVSIGSIGKLDPIIDRPASLTLDGILTVQGHYATRPETVRFDLGFLFEYPTWRLFRLSVTTAERSE